MKPIHYDLIVCIVSLLFGLYMFYKIGVLNRRIYTPFLPAMVISSGLIYWGALLLVSYAAVYHEPSWLYVGQVEWSGTWGYTAGRILNGVCWLLTLAAIKKYLKSMRLMSNRGGI